jgi:hypothetical protein
MSQDPKGLAAPPNKPGTPSRDKEPALPGVQDLVLPTIAGEYRHALPIKVSTRFLRWLVPVCLILIFLLSFFPWVGAYPSGHGLFFQNGWYTAFGSWSYDSSVDKVLEGKIDKEKDAPGVSVLMIFYMILLCLLMLASIAVIVFHLIPTAPPPSLRMILQWQGLILGGAALLIFLFLGIELLKGFNLTNRIQSLSDKDNSKSRDEERFGKHGVDVLGAMNKSAMGLRTTFWFRLVVLLNLLAILGGAMQFWMARRGHKPPPKLEFAW